MKKHIIIILILIFCLPVIACSGGDETPPEVVVDQPTEPVQQEDLPDVSEDDSPAQVQGTQVTSIDQIVGTWIATADLGNFVTTIYPDGVFSVATSLVDLEAGSTDSWNLVIEDGQITATDFALCLGDTGTYLAVINADGTLKFTSIIDPCDPRLRKMDRSLPGRLNPYNLIYNRVEQ